MSEIKVGEYVRTEIGTIGKVESIEYAGEGTRYYGEELERNYYTIDYNDDEYGRFDDDGIVKHSPNIIDLIEFGDLITLEYSTSYNRKRRTRIFEVNKVCDNIILENAHCNIYCKPNQKKIIDSDDICKNIKIKSIVTHEQFAEMEYKV